PGSQSWCRASAHAAPGQYPTTASAPRADASTCPAYALPPGMALRYRLIRDGCWPPWLVAFTRGLEDGVRPSSASTFAKSRKVLFAMMVAGFGAGYLPLPTATMCGCFDASANWERHVAQ